MLKLIKLIFRLSLLHKMEDNVFSEIYFKLERFSNINKMLFLTHFCLKSLTLRMIVSQNGIFWLKTANFQLFLLMSLYIYQNSG